MHAYSKFKPPDLTTSKLFIMSSTSTHAFIHYILCHHHWLSSKALHQGSRGREQSLLVKMLKSSYISPHYFSTETITCIWMTKRLRQMIVISHRIMQCLGCHVICLDPCFVTYHYWILEEKLLEIENPAEWKSTSSSLSPQVNSSASSFRKN